MDGTTQSSFLGIKDLNDFIGIGFLEPWYVQCCRLMILNIQDEKICEQLYQKVFNRVLSPKELEYNKNMRNIIFKVDTNQTKITDQDKKDQEKKKLVYVDLLAFFSYFKTPTRDYFIKKIQPEDVKNLIGDLGNNVFITHPLTTCGYLFTIDHPDWANLLNIGSLDIKAKRQQWLDVNISKRIEIFSLMLDELLYLYENQYNSTHLQK